MHEVTSKCGSPDWIDRWEEQRLVRNYGQTYPKRGLNLPTHDPIATLLFVTIEEWTYNFGPNRFVRYLRFENNRLVDIYSGEYGY